LFFEAGIPTSRLANLIFLSKSPYCLIGAVLFSGAFWSCSDKKEPGPEKGAIKKMTEETAREAVNQIHTPIDKARSVATQPEDKNMNDTLKNQ
jgi:hypothetical protein